MTLPRTRLLGATLAASLLLAPLAQAGDEECVLQVTLDPADLARTRRRIPVLRHRRL